MDTKKIDNLGYIIDTLKDELDFAKSKLHRLTHEYEAAGPSVPATVQSSSGAEPASEKQYGAVSLPVHYTLGRGLPEKLSDNVEYAVFRAFHEAARSSRLQTPTNCEIDVSGVGIAVEMLWDKELKLACLHLELVHTDSSISNDEWDAEEGELFVAAQTWN